MTTLLTCCTCCLYEVMLAGSSVGCHACAARWHGACQMRTLCSPQTHVTFSCCCMTRAHLRISHTPRTSGTFSKNARFLCRCRYGVNLAVEGTAWQVTTPVEGQPCAADLLWVVGSSRSAGSRGGSTAMECVLWLQRRPGAHCAAQRPAAGRGPAITAQPRTSRLS